MTKAKNFTSGGTFYFDYSVKAKKMSVAAQRATLTIPPYQKAVSGAQATYDQAYAAVVSAQTAVNQAVAGVASAQANLDAAGVALAQAQQNYNTALAQDQAAVQAVTTA